MRIAVLNYCGTVGKTTISAHLLAPRMDAKVFSIESINESADTYGIDIKKLKGEKFIDLYKELLILDNAIIDIGASNIESFLDRLIKFEGSEEEFDLFVIPVVPGAKEQKETIATITALLAAEIDINKIKVILNRVDSDPNEEFAAIFGFCQLKGINLSLKSVIHENEVFDMLNKSKMTIGDVLNDENDYKALIRSGEGDIKHFTNMIALKSLAKRTHKELNRCYESIVE